MVRLENIRAGEYDFLYSETFVLANTREVSFYVADNTPQKLKITIKLSDNPSEQNILRQDENDNHHLKLIMTCATGEKLVSKEFVRIGTFDEDSKPLFIGFYISVLNEVSRILVLNFYTMKHGKDIG